MARPTLEVTVRRTGDTTVITAAGEADMAGTPILRDALAAAVDEGAGSVALDLARVEIIDSSGLATLLNAARRLRRLGSSLSVVAAGPQVLRVIRLAHLEGDLGLRTLSGPDGSGS
ncbi:MAG TPA: STAS domain-containing protein [Solirubrobacteraceae bacterium]|jgi:anti-sigma B factor antagonist